MLFIIIFRPPPLSARSQQVQPSSDIIYQEVASIQTLRSLPEMTLTTWDGPSRYSSVWLGSSRYYRTWDGPPIYSSTFLGPSSNLEMLSQRSWYH